VLVGMGGLGKSTVALSVAEAARAKGWRVWWVNAADTASLTGGMLEVLRQLGGPEWVTQPVREGAPAAADRVWEFLNGSRIAGRRWLLVFDNADNPAVLAAHGTASPANHAGWLRPDPCGMVIVTTRVKDPRVWGPRVALRELAPLDDASAARVLADLAPGIVDPGGVQARELGRRLGGLPLALHLAGSCLASPFARWHSFADYCRALHGVDLSSALADLDDPAADARTTIRRTWDLSLDALAADGRPQARPLLLLLSCYAPAIPIPAMLLQRQALTPLLMPGGQPPAVADEDFAAERGRRLRVGLQALAAVGLINIAGDNSHAETPTVTVHPVVADANCVRLRGMARTDLATIGAAAVGLLQANARELDCRRPADWPDWRRIIAHIAALLEKLATHLDASSLAGLLAVSDAAVAFLWECGNHAAAERLARLSASMAAGLGDNHTASLTARQTFTSTIAGRGQYAEAEQLYHQLLSDQEQILGDEHYDTLKTRHGLAWTIGKQGRYAEAERLYHQLLSDEQRILGNEHPDTLDTRHDYVHVIGLQGRYREAEQAYRRLLTDQQVLCEERGAALTTRYALAQVIGSQGRYREAGQLCRDVLTDRQRILGDDHPTTLAVRDRLAWMIASQGSYGEAERIYDEVLTDRQRILGDDHPDTLTTRSGLAWVIGMQGRFWVAEPLYWQLLADQKRILGDDHPHTLLTQHTLAWVTGMRGQHEAARHMYCQVLTAQRRILGDDHPDTLYTLHELARLARLQGRREEAGQLYRDVLARREQVLGDKHPDTARTRKDLARLQASRGKGVWHRGRHRLPLWRKRGTPAAWAIFAGGHGRGMPDVIVELDRRRRASLGHLGRPEHTRYLAREEPDGTIVLEPVAVMSGTEPSFPRNQALAGRGRELSPRPRSE
jgi:tetratricopeptide (TPR) repeat protein